MMPLPGAGVTYRGFRTDAGALVTRHERDGRGGSSQALLDPRHDVRNHSPDGFNWGYGGSGPAQLALALCIDALGGDVDRARVVYQEFKWRVIARLPGDSWELRGEYVTGVLAELLGAHAPAADDGPARPVDSTDSDQDEKTL